MDVAAAVTELKRSTDTFGPFIRAQAERISDRIALRFEDDTVTYGAYDRAVNRMAARLGREGVARGTPVAILAPNSPLFLVALGAVAKLGAIGALINTHVTGAGLRHVLGDRRLGRGRPPRPRPGRREASRPLPRRRAARHGAPP